MKENDIQAFPLEYEQQDVYGSKWKQNHAGMSLRDYFAGKAMQTLIGKLPKDIDKMSRVSYEIADAMLKARKL